MKQGVTWTGAVFAVMAMALVIAVVFSYSYQPSARIVTVVETTTTTLPVTTISTITSVSYYVNVENCTYTATSSFVNAVSEGANQAGVTTTSFQGGVTTTTVSYVTKGSLIETIGAVVTTSTSPSAQIKYFYGADEQVTAIVQPPFIGEPYSVTCTFVK